VSKDRENKIATFYLLSFVYSTTDFKVVDNSETKRKGISVVESDRV
jgi:hypothetical protein